MQPLISTTEEKQIDLKHIELEKANRKEENCKLQEITRLEKLKTKEKL